MMKPPEAQVPSQTMNAANQCMRWPKRLLAEEEDAEEGGFEEEGERALHRQRLRDHVARVGREARPVRAELELHRDAGHDAQHEGDGEDARPEARRAVIVSLFARAGRAS